MDVSEAKEKVVVVLRREVSSMSAGAICDEAKPSSRAMECSRKSCSVAMSRSGICALKEKNCVCGRVWSGIALSGEVLIDLHTGACHEAVG